MQMTELQNQPLASWQDMVDKLLPGLGDNLALMEAFGHYYGSHAQIPHDLDDLRRFLRRDGLFRLVRCEASDMRGAALHLIDHHPEFGSAQGMLRCYLANGEFQWVDCERAETEIGRALTMEPYGWEPDGFNVVVVPELQSSVLLAMLVYT